MENNLPNRADVVIIGGGAIGLCSAYFLQQRGREVLLLEKGELLSGCSGGNAGLICPSHIEPLATPAILAQGLAMLFRSKSPFRIKPRFDLGLLSWLLNFHKACRASKVRQSMPVLHQLLQQSRSLFQDLCSREGFAELQEKGLLMVHRTEKGARGHRTLANAAEGMNLRVETLDKTELFAKEGNVPEASTGGIFFPTDAHIDPQSFLSNMAKHLVDQGAQIFANTTVSNLHTNGRIATSKGEVVANQVLIAAGSWSATLAKQLKQPLLLQPGKGYTLSVSKPKGAPKTPMILAEEKVSITPLADSLRFGGTLELAGFDSSINLKRTHNIAKVAQSYAPQDELDDLRADDFWHGYRPCTPDGLPMIGFFPDLPRIAVATGHAMLGISLAPVTGKLVAELLEGTTTSLPLAPLSPRRF